VRILIDPPVDRRRHKSAIADLQVLHELTVAFFCSGGWPGSMGRNNPKNETEISQRMVSS